MERDASILVSARSIRVPRTRANAGPAFTDLAPERKRQRRGDALAVRDLACAGSAGLRRGRRSRE